MPNKVLLLLWLFSTSAVANPALFDYLRPKQSVVVVLPDGTCDAKVTQVQHGQLIARLKETKRFCGTRGKLVTVMRTDVRDVIERPRVRPDSGTSRSAICAGAVLAFVGATAAQYLGSDAVGSQTGGLAVLVASGIAGGWLCRDPTPRYVVVTDRVTAAQP